MKPLVLRVGRALRVELVQHGASASVAYFDLASGDYYRGSTPGVSVLLNWTGLAASPCVVVPVTRLRRGIAKRAINDAGCRLGHIRYRYSRKVRKNRVISQRPHYGAVLASHAQVHLVVSRGRRR